MSILNVGTWEFVIILLIAILAVGPERIVKFSRMVGHVVGKLRTLSSEFTASIQEEMDAVDEATRATLSEASVDEEEVVATIPDELRAADEEVKKSVHEIAESGQKAVSGFTADVEALRRRVQGRVAATEAKKEKSGAGLEAGEKETIASVPEELHTPDEETEKTAQEDEESGENPVSGAKADPNKLKKIQGRVGAAEANEEEGEVDEEESE